MRYRRFRCGALIFCPLALLPVGLIRMPAVVSTFGDSGTRKRLS
jgi:hypothetical protein